MLPVPVVVDVPNGVFVVMTFEDMPKVTALLLDGCEGIFCGALPNPNGFGTVVVMVMDDVAVGNTVECDGCTVDGNSKGRS
jgi:hypothetical protein